MKALLQYYARRLKGKTLEKNLNFFPSDKINKEFERFHKVSFSFALEIQIFKIFTSPGSFKGHDFEYYSVFVFPRQNQTIKFQGFPTIFSRPDNQNHPEKRLYFAEKTQKQLCPNPPQSVLTHQESYLFCRLRACI